MISFHDFTLTDDGPIYWQILRHIKKGIVAGSICDGDELPSRRMLSTLLGVNPNTVQKAYAMLEEEGLVVSRMGAKSSVVLNESVFERVKSELTQEYSQKAVFEFRELGLSLKEAIDLIRLEWEKEENL